MRSTGFPGASHSPSPAAGVLSDALLARVLDRIESASPIMLGPWDERRNLTMSGGSNPGFYK
jgi:hypothetical protein